MPDDETPADRLRLAAARVRRAWTTRELFNAETGACCAVGGVLNIGAETPIDLGDDEIAAVLVQEDNLADQAVQALYRHLLDSSEGDDIPDRDGAFECITWWNDLRAGQTAGNVAATMEAAATAWEAEHA